MHHRWKHETEFITRAVTDVSPWDVGSRVWLAMRGLLVWVTVTLAEQSLCADEGRARVPVSVGIAHVQSDDSRASTDVGYARYINAGDATSAKDVVTQFGGGGRYSGLKAVPEPAIPATPIPASSLSVEQQVQNRDALRKFVREGTASSVLFEYS